MYGSLIEFIVGGSLSEGNADFVVDLVWILLN